MGYIFIMNNYNNDVLEIIDFKYSTDYHAETGNDGKGAELQEHEYYEVFLMLEGSASVLIGNTLYDLRPTEALIIPPDLKHLILPENNPIFRSMSFQFKLSPTCVEDLKTFLSSPTVMICNSSPELITHIHTIVHTKFFFRADEFALMVKGLTTQLVMLLYKYHKLADPKTDNLHFLTIHLLAYINQHLTEKITLKALSSYFKFNENYISRTFKKDMKVTVMQYVNDRRMQLAKTLIYGGEKPIQAMYKSGHTDYPNFYRNFVKRYGTSPKQLWIKYRKESPV